MRLPTFAHDAAQWDRWKAFHKNYGPYTVFDTGEVITTGWYFRQRHTFAWENEKLGLAIIASDDFGWGFRKAELRTPDGDKVLRSWLDTGCCFVWDKDTNHLVHMDTIDDGVPTRFRKVATSYFAGPGVAPVGGKLILRKPRERTPEEKEGVANVRAIAKAWRKLDDHGKMHSGFYSRRAVPLERLAYVGFDFEALTDTEKVALADTGVSSSVERLEFSYLQMQKGG